MVAQLPTNIAVIGGMPILAALGQGSGSLRKHA
jgi:hypothetical protein